ncbi:MAG: bifunctional adenosylcobinamide kinase/adenosylcobinamide-phosphate guanylyltransferase [Spongiibacteraceae bacterium]
MKQLIIGGARSGKSAIAEQLAINSNKTVIYIATANRAYNDSEMTSRIAHHQQRRPSHWQTVETPLQLAEQLQLYAAADRCILVDCLTLWLSNCLFSVISADEDSIDQTLWIKQRKALMDTLPTLAGDIIMVGNEVGSGIVPMGAINRLFVDESGFLHQSIAAHCDRVIFTAAGLPLVMKGEPL